MATVLQEWIARGVARTVWTLVNAETGASQSAPTLPDKSVEVSGTFGVGGTVVLEGSNTGTTWTTLNDPQGNPLSFTVNKIETLLENPRFIRPRVTGGDGTTALTVTLIEQSTQR